MKRRIALGRKRKEAAAAAATAVDAAQKATNSVAHGLLQASTPRVDLSEVPQEEYLRSQLYEQINRERQTSQLYRALIIDALRGQS